jgi:FecR-like protein
MSNDYLWDGSGVPGPDDADVVRLERTLGRLRAPLPPTPHIDVRDRVRRAASPPPLAWRSVRFAAPLLATAAVVAAMIAVAWQSSTMTGVTGAWDVASLTGRPRIGSTIVGAAGRFAVGQTLVTDARSRARLDVSTIGGVIVDVNTRVRLVETRRGRHRLALERGTLHASIGAPPGQFVVDTPSATATDLGCVYSLTVDEDGTGWLSVRSGWVAFEHRGRESFVPAGASSRTDPTLGPGTPRYDDADAAFKAALDYVDRDAEASQRAAALAFVLEHARARDAMTLWHLVRRVDAAGRGAVVDALAERAPLPPGVARADVMRLDPSALDRWWDSLGLMDVGWWRMWKGDVPVKN